MNNSRIETMIERWNFLLSEAIMANDTETTMWAKGAITGADTAIYFFDEHELVENLVNNSRIEAMIERWEVLLQSAVNEGNTEEKQKMMNQLYGMMVTLACLNETKLAEKVLKIYEGAEK